MKKNGFLRSPVCIPSAAVEQGCRHTFGGELSPAIVPPGGKAPCHLLFTLDTLDPLFPVRIKGTRFLPLIHAQQYNCAAISYRMEAGTMVVDWIESLDWNPDFPYENYPAGFPLQGVSLAVPDLRKLEELESARGDTMELGTRFGGWHFLCQGIPDVACRNPACGKGPMNVFGVIYNVALPGTRIWDPDQDWNGNELIYQICSRCSSIQVCSRC